MKKAFRLTVDVVFELNGASEEDIKDNLECIPIHAKREGLFTMDTDAEIEFWESSAEVV